MANLTTGFRGHSALSCQPPKQKRVIARMRVFLICELCTFHLEQSLRWRFPSLEATARERYTAGQGNLSSGFSSGF